MNRKSVTKVVISILMLMLVMYSVDLNELRHNLASISISSAMVLIIGYAFSQTISAIRWWIVTQGAGIHSKLTSAISASFVGMYINVFGLGTLGGDLARAVLITSDSQKRQTSIATVVADRVFGLAVLILIGIVSSIFFYTDKLNSSVIVTALVLVIIVASAWVLGPWIIKRFFNGTKLNDVVERLNRGFPRDPKILLAMFVVALVFHLTQIALFDYLAMALNVSIPFSYLLVTIPFANIIATLPLSWMGLGVRENVYVFFFVPQFLTHEQAVVCGALWLIAMTATSAIGGIIAVASGALKNLKKANA